jgi:hypothetical protein
MRSQKPSVLGSSLLAAVVAACSPGRASGSGPDADTTAPPTTSGSSQGPGAGPPVALGEPPPPPPSGDEAQQEMKLLKMTLASGVRDKEPVDKLTAAKPGQRVWAHVTLRNRSGFPREIDLVFRVDGKERSRVTLNIDVSWSFRTWGYVTLRPTDTSGDVTVTVVNDSGDELAAAKIPIKP